MGSFAEPIVSRLRMQRYYKSLTPPNDLQTFFKKKIMFGGTEQYRRDYNTYIHYLYITRAKAFFERGGCNMYVAERNRKQIYA